MNATTLPIINIDDITNKVASDQRVYNITFIVLQMILILKPVLMYWIQARYHAPPPHPEINRGDNVDNDVDNEDPSVDPPLNDHDSSRNKREINSASYGNENSDSLSEIDSKIIHTEVIQPNKI